MKKPGALAGATWTVTEAADCWKRKWELVAGDKDSIFYKDFDDWMFRSWSWCSWWWSGQAPTCLEWSRLTSARRKWLQQCHWDCPSRIWTFNKKISFLVCFYVSPLWHDVLRQYNWRHVSPQKYEKAVLISPLRTNVCQTFPVQFLILFPKHGGAKTYGNIFLKWRPKISGKGFTHLFPQGRGQKIWENVPQGRG